MTIRERAEATVAEWDAKYRRVAHEDFVGLGSEDSPFIVRDELCAILARRDSGQYKVVCCDIPDLGDFDSDVELTDAEYEEFDRHMKELGVADVLWVIPRGDERFDTENEGVLFSGIIPLSHYAPR